MADADICVCCGEAIPEGYGLTCYSCNNKQPASKWYDVICDKLNGFDCSNDTEATNNDWLEEFYLLLVRIKNAFECKEII